MSFKNYNSQNSVKIKNKSIYVSVQHRTNKLTQNKNLTPSNHRNRIKKAKEEHRSHQELVILCTRELCHKPTRRIWSEQRSEIYQFGQSWKAEHSYRIPIEDWSECGTSADGVGGRFCCFQTELNKRNWNVREFYPCFHLIHLTSSCEYYYVLCFMSMFAVVFMSMSFQFPTFIVRKHQSISSALFCICIFDLIRQNLIE